VVAWGQAVLRRENIGKITRWKKIIPRVVIKNMLQPSITNTIKIRNIYKQTHSEDQFATFGSRSSLDQLGVI
jgi:hypothetical protein